MFVLALCYWLLFSCFSIWCVFGWVWVLILSWLDWGCFGFGTVGLVFCLLVAFYFGVGCLIYTLVICFSLVFVWCMVMVFWCFTGWLGFVVGDVCLLCYFGLLGWLLVWLCCVVGLFWATVWWYFVYLGVLLRFCFEIWFGQFRGYLLRVRFGDLFSCVFWCVYVCVFELFYVGKCFVFCWFAMFFVYFCCMGSGCFDWCEVNCGWFVELV